MKLVDVGMGERSARRERRAARVTDGAWGEARRVGRGTRSTWLELELEDRLCHDDITMTYLHV
jgi:hypothetical protein